MEDEEEDTEKYNKNVLCKITQPISMKPFTQLFLKTLKEFPDKNKPFGFYETKVEPKDKDEFNYQVKLSEMYSK